MHSCMDATHTLPFRFTYLRMLVDVNELVWILLCDHPKKKQRRSRMGHILFKLVVQYWPESKRYFVIVSYIYLLLGFGPRKRGVCFSVMS